MYEVIDVDKRDEENNIIISEKEKARVENENAKKSSDMVTSNPTKFSDF